MNCPECESKMDYDDGFVKCQNAQCEHSEFWCCVEAMRQQYEVNASILLA